MAGTSAEPPRVALVCGRYRPDRDGVADYVRRLAGRLPARGVTPIVATATGPGLAPDTLALGRDWRLPGTLRAARQLRAQRPDVVHVQFAPSAYRYRPAVGLLPLLLAGAVPVVTTLHEYGWWAWPRWVPARAWPTLERRGWWDRETLALVPRSARVLVTTAGHAAAVRDRFAGRVEVVEVPIGPNVPDAGHDRPGARAAVRTELGLPPDALLVVFFGFVHPVKGVRYLVEAVAALRVEHPRLHLLVVGGFESLALPGAQAAAFEREIRGLVAGLGLADSVTITGYRPAEEVSRLLAASDVAAFPFTPGVTTKSGALLAAYEHGLPVVATRGAYPDPALVDGTSAVLVDRVRDAAALASGLRRLLDDPALRARVAAGGRAVAAAHSWEAIAARHAVVYAEVLAGG